MASERASLWPADIATKAIVAPVALMKQQAALLGEYTQNVVTAEVRSSSPLGLNTFVHRFYVVAPALDHYRFELFSVAHGIELYPVSVYFEAFPDGKRSAASQDEFLDAMETVLQSEKAKTVVSTLLAQSDGAKPDLLFRGDS